MIRSIVRSRQFGFILVGVTVMIIGAGLLILAVEGFKVDPTVAKVIEVVISTQLTYIGSRMFPERGRDLGSWKSGLVRHNLSRATSALLTMGTFWVLAEQLSLHYLTASFISVGGAMVLNYWLRVTWVFRDASSTARLRKLLGWVRQRPALFVAAIALAYGAVRWMSVEHGVYVLVVVVLLLMTFVAVSSFWLSMYAWQKPAHMEQVGFGKRLSPKHKLSIIYPVRGSRLNITGPTVAAMTRQDHGNIEIIMVVSGDDDNGVRDDAHTLRSLYPDVVSVAYVYGADKNKPKALNAAFSRCTGDVIGIVDAESITRPGLLTMIDSKFQTSGADIVQGGVQLMNIGDSWYSLLNCMEYYRWFKSRLHWHALLKLITLGGNTVFFKRHVIERLGGWDEGNLAEDCEIGVRASVAGFEVAVAYDPLYVTEESTPSSPWKIMKQRIRWMQGFIQTYTKGVWKELDSRQMRWLARYTLLMPVAQAFFGMLIPLSIAAVIWAKIPILLAMFTFVPLAIGLVTLVADLGALDEFGRDFGVKIKWRYRVWLVSGTFLYQGLLAAAAVGALWRHARAKTNWDLTEQVGQHHKSTPVLVAVKEQL